MTSTTLTLLTSARQRGQEQSLPYAGAVTPEEAFALLESDINVLLVDVRTNAERDWIGRVKLSDAQHHAVQWSTYPGGNPNPDFLTELTKVTADKNTTILFLCRSGVRSRHAAKLATENGYIACFDILEGFEGDKDSEGHRKTLGGWCQRGLPWLGA
ncbi:rhodanese-related sulfurtransferase [Undibacterium sp. GrIS 1.2]|uniref:rhodanese-like domain-containing protein n=1 Tax=Undibacterium sp. GrIS 1.2 TaxID=3143933 RepID=UPI00339384C8